MDNLKYDLRVSDAARAVMHPSENHDDVVRKIRNIIQRRYILTRQRDPNDKRGAFLLAAPDTLIASVLTRIFDTGIKDREASKALAVRLNAWSGYDFDPNWDEKSAVNMPENTPRDPATYIWNMWRADPSTAKFSVSVRWFRHFDTGLRTCRAHINHSGHGTLGKELNPGPDWEIAGEFVLVLDEVLSDLNLRLTVLKKAH